MPNSDEQCEYFKKLNLARNNYNLFSVCYEDFDGEYYYFVFWNYSFQRSYEVF